MASAILQGISQDERERALFHSRKKARMDWENDMLVAEEKGEKRSDKKWKGVVADKDAKLADHKAVIADQQAEIARLKTELANL